MVDANRECAIKGSFGSSPGGFSPLNGDPVLCVKSSNSWNKSGESSIVIMELATRGSMFGHTLLFSSSMHSNSPRAICSISITLHTFGQI